MKRKSKAKKKASDSLDPAIKIMSSLIEETIDDFDLGSSDAVYRALTEGIRIGLGHSRNVIVGTIHACPDLLAAPQIPRIAYDTITRYERALDELDSRRSKRKP